MSNLNVGEKICVGIVLIISSIIFSIMIYDMFNYQPIEYEYIDLNNNKGIAISCSYKFEKSFKGGQGSPVCELEDGTILQVKQYKKRK